MKQATVPPHLFERRSNRDIRGVFSSAELARTQRMLGVKLPAAYVAALKIQNGGSLCLTAYRMSKSPARSAMLGSGREYTSLTSIAGIDPKHWNALTQLWQTAHSEWGLDPRLVPFDGDGHWWAVSEVQGKRNGEARVAASFGQLLKGLRRARDSTEPAMIALDKPRVRGAKLAAILKSLGCVKYKWTGVVYSKYALPRAWEWPKYRGPWRGSVARLVEAKNRSPGNDVDFTLRPAGHKILRVQVRYADTAACARELIAALGAGAELLSQDA
ncbi:MAG: SMI1/KNR4 family protein [Phycisphaerales bacterium]